jgi:radical SAM/Cys-rich protein
LVASFPSTSLSRADAQRGEGVGEAGIRMLKRLNELGYGVDGSGLELNLVSNPVGAFLPPDQAQAEAKFRQDLSSQWEITFNRLYTFGNVPLGRFRSWLLESGNHDRYVRALAAGFNPCTVEGLMCRTQLSVSWDGYLYDCDFNLAARRPLDGRMTHVSELRRLPHPGSPIAVGDYCYACTAGSGFT